MFARPCEQPIVQNQHRYNVLKTSVFIATSLDGYIARKDGSIDWLLALENPANDDYGYGDFIKTVDAIVMGRSTFETVLTFPTWPYDKKVFVLSTSLKRVPDNLTGKAEVLSAPPKALLDELSRKGYSHLYVDGGKTIQRFLNEDLIDEMTVTKIPVLLGDGIHLFGRLDRDIHFDHIETKVYPNGLVKSHYTRKEASP